MNHIDENKENVLLVLKSQDYKIDEVEGTILASKYCQRSTGGVICLLVEAPPPFDKFLAWGARATHTEDSDIGRLVNALNSSLFELIR